jgi:hypothetical protein
LSRPNQSERLIQCREVERRRPQWDKHEISGTEVYRGRGSGTRRRIDHEDGVTVTQSLTFRFVNPRSGYNHRRFRATCLGPSKRCSLRIGVDNRDSLAGKHGRYRKMHRHCCLSGSALLSSYGDRYHEVTVSRQAVLTQ